ncbi:MAG: glycosyltransferase family 9 protein [Actinomycetota bacterium]
MKTGYSEVLDNGDGSQKVSFGDILRTTPLLHVYPDAHVTWVTDEAAFPLLKGNNYIDRLLHLNFTNAMHLLDESFDTIINLEKNHDICKFSGKLKAWRRYGFRFDERTNKAEAYDRASEILTVSSDSKIKKENKKTVQELLFNMIGKEWKGEEYILGYVPKSREVYDIGFNTIVGKKWPTKLWPSENWDKLEEMLRTKFIVSRQEQQGSEILQDLYRYIDWINSCKSIITNDSLGLHIALVLKKKVLCLLGPTADKEIYYYNRGKSVFPNAPFECRPCFKPECDKYQHSCMESISPEMVCNEIKNLLSSRQDFSTDF